MSRVLPPAVPSDGRVSEPGHRAVHRNGAITTMDPRMKAYFRGGELVLDVGCGDGTLLCDVGTKYSSAVGLDINRARFPERGSSNDVATFIVADLNRGFPFESDSADAVLANQVIEHIANPLFFVAEVHRVLKPRGVFVAATPNVRYMRHLWRLIVRGQGPMTSTTRSRTADDWDHGHLHFFTPTDLSWLAHAVGFRLVETRALIERQGRLAPIRWLVDRNAPSGLVKNFFSGNSMLIAGK